MDVVPMFVCLCKTCLCVFVCVCVHAMMMMMQVDFEKDTEDSPHWATALFVHLTIIGKDNQQWWWGREFDPESVDTDRVLLLLTLGCCIGVPLVEVLYIYISKVGNPGHRLSPISLDFPTSWSENRESIDTALMCSHSQPLLPFFLHQNLFSNCLISYNV